MKRSYKLDLDGLDGISETEESPAVEKPAGISQPETVDSENSTLQTNNTNLWLGITAGVCAIALLVYLIFILSPNDISNQQTQVASTTNTSVEETKPVRAPDRNSTGPGSDRDTAKVVESVISTQPDNQTNSHQDLQKQPVESMIVQEDHQRNQVVSSKNRDDPVISAQQAMSAPQADEQKNIAGDIANNQPERVVGDVKPVGVEPTELPSTPIDESDLAVDNKPKKGEFVIPFRFNRTVRNDFTRAYLGELRNFIDRCPSTIKIIGHTCNLGPAAANLYVGRTRAESIRKLLLKMGIAADRIKTSSAGEQHPVASNSTRSGRALNRRVVVSCPNPSEESEKLL